MFGLNDIEIRSEYMKDVLIRIKGTEYFKLYNKERLRQIRKEINKFLLFIDPKNATNDFKEDLKEVNREAPRFGRNLRKYIFRGQRY